MYFCYKLKKNVFLLDFVLRRNWVRSVGFINNEDYLLGCCGGCFDYGGSCDVCGCVDYYGCCLFFGCCGYGGLCGCGFFMCCWCCRELDDVYV